MNDSDPLISLLASLGKAAGLDSTVPTQSVVGEQTWRFTKVTEVKVGDRLCWDDDTTVLSIQTLGGQVTFTAQDARGERHEWSYRDTDEIRVLVPTLPSQTKGILCP